MRITRPSVADMAAWKINEIKRQATALLRSAQDDLDKPDATATQLRGQLRSVLAKARTDLAVANDIAAVRDYRPAWPT